VFCGSIVTSELSTVDAGLVEGLADVGQLVAG
jgi:hypothetical protein